MTRSLILLTPLAALALSGCLAKTVAGVVTAPVRVADKAVDWTTTSQSEADRNRGRAMRKRDEQIGHLQRRYNREIAMCNQGQSAACADASRTDAEIQDLQHGN